MAELASLVQRLEVVTSRLENVAGGGGSSAGGSAGGELAAFVKAYDEIIGGSLAEFIEKSNKIGGDVATQGALVKAAFNAQREFLVVVSRSKQPSQDVLMKLLQPTSDQISASQDFREKNRKSKFFNHLSTISESIPALGWVMVSPTPGPHVKEMMDAGQFYSNRVLKEFKDKDKTHVEWSRSWVATLNALIAFIKQHHTTGITWNRQGVEASVSAGAGGPAPPPPGPPPVLTATESSSSAGSGDGKAALFADLNKGAGVTQGLRKVTDDQKTHKNPALRQGPAPFKAPGSSPSTVRSQAAQPAVVKPPKCELEGKKWIIEHQKNNQNLVLDKVNMKQGVYLFKCEGTTVQIKDKVNTITLDNCKKTAVVFTDAISAVEFVNCQSVQAQVTGKVATVSIDKTDGCMVYLSKNSIEADIVTAKSSEINILVPDKNGEFSEYALPEQFKSKWNGKKFVTTPSDINA